MRTTRASAGAGSSTSPALSDRLGLSAQHDRRAPSGDHHELQAAHRAARTCHKQPREHHEDEG